MEPQASLLVVDDSAFNRDMLSRRLQRRGYAVDVAAGGREALELVGAKRYDVILLDLVMPDIGGLDVLRTIRETRTAAELPVIIATAKHDSEDIVEGLNAGANDYITKPLDMAVVLARVQTQLSLKHAVEQIRELERTLESRNAALEHANASLTAANARMERDIASASRIQQAMLPAAPVVSDRVNVGWLFRPSAEIAGDALNVFQFDDDRVGFYVLDVVGHGIAAALLSVAVSRMLSPVPDSFLVRRESNGTGYRLLPPAAVGDELNRRFPWDRATEQFFTLVYGMLDVATGKLTFISAGHPPPIVLARDAASAVIVTGDYGLPVGVEERPYVEHTLQLAPGDRVYCYSDGFTEAMTADHRPFTTQRVLDCIADARGKPLDASLEHLWQAVEAWSAGKALDDDASIVALEVSPQ